MRQQCIIITEKYRMLGKEGNDNKQTKTTKPSQNKTSLYFSLRRSVATGWTPVQVCDIFLQFLATEIHLFLLYVFGIDSL
jgi:hypothetical protein